VVESALARAQGKLGVIPAEAADSLAEAAGSLQVDFGRLEMGAERSGLPVIALIDQIREQTGESAATYVHWGATSQDIIDTALVLQIRSSLERIEPALRGLIQGLAKLADQHRRTVMAGRTHSQQALPIPFGYKVAGWLAPLLRHRQRLNEIKPRLLVVQLGGATGTLAPFGSDGILLQAELAAELDLEVPLMPWHTQRDNLVELADWLSLVSGALAKMSQDIILLSQTEIGELRETADPSRGGSSTMPQKSNPVVSEFIIAAARTNFSLLSSMNHALIQEQERATHGWQIEWICLPQMLSLTASSLERAVFLSKNLSVHIDRMRENVEASNGLMLAEAVTFALAGYMDRFEAKELVKEACRIALDEDRNLVDVVREHTTAPLDWEGLRDERAYFGSSNALIDRVLEQAERITLENDSDVEKRRSRAP
jgi:3-carboxy-cis,cis-muconate cycloisomerase